MNSENKFKELYRRLNPEQRKAVDSIEGPVMVIAGPGTGKTQILTLRIANILRKTDIHPSNILALTFTESAASSMRRRLAEIIGSAAYAVHIRTFHAFCNEIIRDYPEEFPHIIGATAMTNVEQIQLMAEIIDGANLQHLKPMGDPHYYVRLAISAIATLKQEGVRPKEFATLVASEEKEIMEAPNRVHEKGAHRGKVKGEYLTRERVNAKQKELAKIYALYQSACAKAKRYDFPDMIMEVLAALQGNHMLLQMLQEQFQYVLIDEHQDTNRAQNMVIDLLSSFHEHPNVFVVGDEKQAIYRFQGASIENFNYLKQKYPNALLIVLTDNYRSSQSILDSAESLLAGHKPLAAKADHARALIEVGSCENFAAECEYIAKRIAEMQAKDVPLHEIAVLYRENRDADEITHALRTAALAYSVETDRDILADHEVHKFLAILDAINRFGEDEPFIKSLHVDFLNIPELDIYLLVSGARKMKIPVLAAARTQKHLREFGLDEEERMRAVYAQFAKWSRDAKNLNLLDLLESIARESGFLGHLLARPDAIEKLEYFTLLFEYAKTLVENKKNADLAAFMEHIATANLHGIGILYKPSRARDNRVRLMTAHKAKGLEFDAVFIMRAYDGHWSNKRGGSKIELPKSIVGAKPDASAGQDDPNADERRLFYVAMTRARKHLVITYPDRDSQDKELLPCQFIPEIKPELLSPLKKIGGPSSPGERFKSSQSTATQTLGLRDAELIKHIFKENGLAVTALNNYLLCPWKYFYTNLIRIPKPPEHHQMFGTAIHAALRDFFATLKDREHGKDFLIQAFIRAITKTAIPESELERWKDRGVKALSGYYQKYGGSWPSNVRTEFEIYGIELTPDVRLTGKLDKIEFVGEGNEVNVVDYKTGKPKSRADIEGKTKTSRGDIKRQLVFYKLLLDRYENGRYRMQSGTIDFVEPDERGKYHCEPFAIESEDAAALEAEILRVADEILNLKFWNSRCGEKTCEFCALRELMR